MMPERWKRLQRSLVFAAVFTAFLLVVILLLSGRLPEFPKLPKVPTELQELPFQLLLSFLRMCLAYGLSLLLGIGLGTWAATRAGAARFLMPLLDIFQAVPVLGFFPVAIAVFVKALGGGRLSLEAASIFLILTSQAWNLAYGVYEGIATLPSDAKESMTAFGVKGWHRFWRLYLPACVPKLVYNSIVSWGNGWYFLIGCEILAVGSERVVLPGIGSYLFLTSQEGQIDLTLGGLLLLLLLIASMDLFIWRPLSRWSEKYRYEFEASSGWTPLESRWLERWQRLHLRNRVRWLRSWLEREFLEPVLRLGEPLARFRPPPGWRTGIRKGLGKLAALTATLLLGYCLYAAGRAAYDTLAQPWPERAKDLPVAIAASFLRLVVALSISISIAFPLAVWAGENKKVARFLTPLAEIGSSVPATALFPVIVVFFIQFGGMNAASILLLLTGMVWYVLFNLLAGVRNIPEDLQEATRAMGLRGWRRWKRLMLPALFPSLITGSITAFGGGWNALIVSEYGVFDNKTYQVLGIGALLQEATFVTHDRTMVLLTILALIVTVVVINRVFWHPLYNLSAERFKIDV